MINLFKGYILTGGKDGKTPLEEYKDRVEFHTLDEIECFKSYGGVLDDDIIQIDVDDYEQSELLLKIIQNEAINCNILRTTRGKHFYFKNTSVNRRKQGFTTAIGIKIDTGLGSQNAVIPLKIEGLKREWICEVDEMDNLPAFLLPLDKKQINFNKMEDGDGRNQTLFNYILKLQSEGLTKEEIRHSIRIINKYILKQPLSDGEIETILRDDSFSKQSFYIKGKLQYEKLAKYLIANENVIKINDQLHIYKDGYYSSDIVDIEKILLKYIQNSTKTPRSEVIRYLELLTVNSKTSNTKYIVVENGVIDLETDKLLEHTPNLIIKNKIPVNYNPNAKHDLLNKTIDKICCYDGDLRHVIEEMVGYCLLRRNELGKSFILTGNGANGKSTLLDLIQCLLGDENISSVAINELNDRFKTYQLEGKLANIGDDIPNSYIPDNSVFKKLVTGEKVNVERKGKDAFDFKNYSKLIFSANELPRINDLSGGLKRRMVFIPFNAKFSKHDPDFDPFINDKIMTTTGIEYLLKIALEGLKRILNNNCITQSEACSAVWDEYEAINNPVISFIEENNIENESTTDVFKRYQVWCHESGLKPLSKIMFGKEIKKQGFDNDKRVTLNGQRCRIYTKINRLIIND